MLLFSCVPPQPDSSNATVAKIQNKGLTTKGMEISNNAAIEQQKV
jgi:hypothetical protein